MSEFKKINLLEEFHDYEIASQVLNELEEGESIMTRHGLVSREVVADAALNYRRENNIYEKGDQIVRYRKGTKPLVWTVLCESSVFENSWACDHPDMMVHHFNSNEMRHATPEEIAAGHRIVEVVPVYANVKFPYKVLTGEQVGAVMNATHFGCDLGDDFPIENHISPNCKAKDV